MTSLAAGLSPDWLALRESADASARSVELVDRLRRLLQTKGVTVVHDLGAGTGSMGRWPAPRLPGRRHWVLYDADRDVMAAFNLHQRRTTDGRRLLGPDAVVMAAELFGRLGFDVLVRPSPWRLAVGESRLATTWVTAWVTAASEVRPGPGRGIGDYVDRRLADATAGRLLVTVDHGDLLAWPR